jgi:hypothetical protein
MTTVQSVCSFFVSTPLWSANWVWGLPLIVLTVVIHVLGLGVIRQKAVHVSKNTFRHRNQTALFGVVMGSVTLLATVLHGIEAILWAAAYRVLHALPDTKSAVLYSLNAITSYGHTSLALQDRWHLMGALEALNGWLLFGLTTAFLFAIIDQFRLDRG